MKVVIKFCGGCDPAFDRVEVFQRVKIVAGDSIEWLQVGQQDYDAVLMVCGCHKACPEDGFRHVSRLVSIKNNGLSPECVVAQILGKGQTDAD
jgi:hypothetical protein